MTHTTLIIARHGNTFDKGDVVLRVGAGTDLPLSQSGQAQATTLGAHLRAQFPEITQAYVSPLQRTQQTCTLGFPGLAQQIDPRLNEVHYGPDEGKPEAEVIARIGETALQQWEQNHIPPQDWPVDVAHIQADWQALVAEIMQKHAGNTVLIITSNGTARFAPGLCDNAEIAAGNTKLRTASYGVLQHDGTSWTLECWNVRA